MCRKHRHLLTHNVNNVTNDDSQEETPSHLSTEENCSGNNEVVRDATGHEPPASMERHIALMLLKYQEKKLIPKTVVSEIIGDLKMLLNYHESSQICKGKLLFGYHGWHNI